MEGIKMIALMSSVPEEGKRLIRGLKKESAACDKIFHSGSVCDREIVYMITGMGKTNAAHATTVLIEKFSPELIILFGVGGAYPSAGLRVGDIAVAEKEIYGDEGVLDSEGFHGTEFIGIPLLKRGRKRFFNEFPLDRRLTKKVLDSLALCPRPQTPIKSGIFVTVSTCTGTRRRALQIERRTGAICENMEGAAVSHICAMYGVPLVEIRGISNIVEDRDSGKWNTGLAAENCQKAVMETLRRINPRA